MSSQVRPVFASQIPGFHTVELPESTWLTIGLDGWDWVDDQGIQRWVPYARVYFTPGTADWSAIIVAEAARSHEEISVARGATMVDALKAAAAELGDSLTIREEWT